MLPPAMFVESYSPTKLKISTNKKNKLKVVYVHPFHSGLGAQPVVRYSKSRPIELGSGELIEFPIAEISKARYVTSRL